MMQNSFSEIGIDPISYEHVIKNLDFALLAADGLHVRPSPRLESFVVCQHEDEIVGVMDIRRFDSKEVTNFKFFHASISMNV
jgi:hypothetical protein